MFIVKPRRPELRPRPIPKDKKVKIEIINVADAVKLMKGAKLVEKMKKASCPTVKCNTPPKKNSSPKKKSTCPSKKNSSPKNKCPTKKNSSPKKKSPSKKK